MRIGFIGQGWIGKNYADDFENRGFSVVRYSLEEPYKNNEDKIKHCDIVFIAVPTPTTPKGFDASILFSALKRVGKGKIAVIKSTLLPGTTEELQRKHKHIYALHSPEFLTMATAARDATSPTRNIIGIPINNRKYKLKAKAVLQVLPRAPYELVCTAREAEFIKYAGNNWFYLKVVYINMIYDLARASGCNYDVIREAMSKDYRIGVSHLIPVHRSGTPGSDNYHTKLKKGIKGGGRGAGGHCFIKDFAAFSDLYKFAMPHDTKGIQALKAIEAKNIDLLLKSKKDLNLLKGVYGK